MNNSLIEYLVPKYVDYFYKNNNYSIVKSYVCCYLLNILYRRFINDKEIKPIEEIPIKIKTNYWNLACEYKEDKEERILCSKAIYTLDVITNTYAGE